MLGYILLFFFLYVLFKIVKFFFRAFSTGAKEPTVNKSKPASSKYKDVEEAKFIEIKEEKQTDKEQSGSNGPK